MFRKGIIFGTNIPNIKCHQIINLFNLLMLVFYEYSEYVHRLIYVNKSILNQEFKKSFGD